MASYRFTVSPIQPGTLVLRLWNKLRRPSSDQPARAGLFGPVLAFERAAYLDAVTVVAAKLAKVDGPVVRSEIDTFKRLFSFDPQESSLVGRLFDLARESAEGFEPFAFQLAEMLENNPDAAADLFERLYAVALADGELTSGETDYLSALARTLGTEARWQSLQARSWQGDPYAVLGIQRDVSDREVRAAWQRLSRRYHPDAVAARGEEESNHERMAEINTAYQCIMRLRRRRVPM